MAHAKLDLPQCAGMAFISQMLSLSRRTPQLLNCAHLPLRHDPTSNPILRFLCLSELQNGQSLSLKQHLPPPRRPRRHPPCLLLPVCEHDIAVAVPSPLLAHHRRNHSLRHRLAPRARSTPANPHRDRVSWPRNPAFLPQLPDLTTTEIAYKRARNSGASARGSKTVERNYRG